MAFDLDDDELKATRKLNGADKILSFVENWKVEFVKAQDEFVITQCIKHLQKDEEVRLFKISEDKLKEIFMLGLAQYQMNNLKDNIEEK